MCWRDWSRGTAHFNPWVTRSSSTRIVKVYDKKTGRTRLEKKTYPIVRLSVDYDTGTITFETVKPRKRKKGPAR